MKHPDCPNDGEHDKHRFSPQDGVMVGCDGLRIPQNWCGTSVMNEAVEAALDGVDKAGRRCDSDLCERPVAHIWEAVVDARFSLVINTKCRFLLCEGHDEFYRDHMTEHRARRIV